MVPRDGPTENSLDVGLTFKDRFIVVSFLFDDCQGKTSQRLNVSIFKNLYEWTRSGFCKVTDLNTGKIYSLDCLETFSNDIYVNYDVSLLLTIG